MSPSSDDRAPRFSWKPPAPPERRTAPRVVPVPELAASAVFLEPASLVDAGLEILDVSAGGVGVLVDGLGQLPDVGTRVELHLFLPETPLPCQLKGRVRSSTILGVDVRMRLGIAFDSATLGVGDRHRRAYEQYLRRCVEAVRGAVD